MNFEDSKVDFIYEISVDNEEWDGVVMYVIEKECGGVSVDILKIKNKYLYPNPNRNLSLGVTRIDYNSLIGEADIKELGDINCHPEYFL